MSEKKRATIKVQTVLGEWIAGDTADFSEEDESAMKALMRDAMSGRSGYVSLDHDGDTTFLPLHSIVRVVFDVGPSEPRP